MQPQIKTIQMGELTNILKNYCVLPDQQDEYSSINCKHILGVYFSGGGGTATNIIYTLFFFVVMPRIFCELLNMENTNESNTKPAEECLSLGYIFIYRLWGVKTPCWERHLRRSRRGMRCGFLHRGLGTSPMVRTFMLDELWRELLCHLSPKTQATGKKIKSQNAKLSH